MARRSVSILTLTPVAVADAAAFTDNGYVALQGGSTTQKIDWNMVHIGGQSTSSAVALLMLARDSTVGATLTALATPNSDGPLNDGTAALAAPPVSFIASTTKPQRATAVTSAKINFTFNCYGGFVRWEPPIGGEFKQLGNAQPLGESSISAFTGSAGIVGIEIIYEPA